MSLSPELSQSLQEKSNLVDGALEQFLRGDAKAVENLHDGLLYSLGLDQDDPNVRGKRIRPALCLVTCEALDGDIQAALPFAMAVELMHNFFLVHDDIEDGDRFRRGRPSTWVHYGLAHGINIGDYMFTKVYSVMLAADKRLGLPLMTPQLQLSLLQLLTDTLDITHVGQAQDMNARCRRDFSVEEYMEMVGNKTGYYLAAPMIGGAVVAGASSRVFEALRGFGRNVGPVFQIVDDIIDLTHGKGRESVGSDIREGKRSFLVAHTASRATEGEREELFHILDLPREETSEADVQRVADLFAKYEAIEAGRACCRAMMDKARESLSGTPARLRETLIAIFEDMLDRKK